MIYKRARDLIMPGIEKDVPIRSTKSECRLCGEMITDGVVAWTKHYQRTHKFKGIE